MPNDYYTRQHDYLPLSIARGDSVQEDFQSVEAGFNKLPHPLPVGRGFSEPLVVADATDAHHAITQGQLDAAMEVGRQQFDDKVLAATVYRGEWASLSGSLSSPATVSHHNMLWFLTRNIPNVAASEPGVSDDWIAINDQRFELFTELAMDYDAEGRVESITEDFFFGERTTTYTYNAQSQVATVVAEALGSRRTETFHYDGSGRLTGITATLEAIP